MKQVLFLFLCFLLTSFSEKEYVKLYFENGKMREEGWVLNGKKTAYWFYYYENGFKKQEGHYLNNQKTNWWIYYDENQSIVKKCEFKDNALNGITLIYENGEIIAAQKYVNGTKVKSYNTLSDFKRDNSNFF